MAAVVFMASCATTPKPAPMTAEELMAATGGEKDRRQARQQREARREKVFEKVAWKPVPGAAAEEKTTEAVSLPDAHDLATALIRSEAFLRRLDGIRAQYPLPEHQRFILDTGTEVLTTASAAPSVTTVELWAGKRRVLARAVAPGSGFSHIGAATQARPLGFSLKASLAADAVPLIFYAPVEAGIWEPDPKTFLPVIPEITPSISAPVIKILVFSASYRGTSVALSKPVVVYLHADADL